MPSFQKCPHFSLCSGCSKELTDPLPAVWNEVTDFFKKWLNPTLRQLSPYHWRYRAKIAVRGTFQNPQLGLFKKNSHEVIPIPDCLVHHPKINQALLLIKKWIIKNKIVPYEEKCGTGELRYIQIVVERSTGKLQIAFVVNFMFITDRWIGLIHLLETMDPTLWHSFWLNFNPLITNTIFSSNWIQIKGTEFVIETFGERSIFYLPSTFGQANLNLFEVMLCRIKEWITPSSNVVEYFAGVGAIGLFILDQCSSVICTEINPHSKVCFDKAQSILPKEIRQKISYVVNSADCSLNLMDRASTIIVDPPRKGLTKGFKEALTASKAKEFIYISCGWESFKIDSVSLIDNGWNLTHLEGFAFFPGSDHIELLAKFNREIK